MTKRYRKQKWAALGMLCAVLFASLPIPVFADGGNTLSEIEIIPDNRLYDWVKDDTVNYIYDFTETNINAYSQDEVNESVIGSVVGLVGTSPLSVVASSV